MREIVLVITLIISLYIVISCSGGGGGGIDPIPTFDTTFFPTTSFTTTTFPITTTTSSPTTSITSTTSSSSSKYLYVKVLRYVSGNVQWLGNEWNEYAYVNFLSDSYSNNKNVYVTDGYYGTYTRFNYDRYTVNYVDVGIYRYYLGDYTVRIGDTFGTSSEAWYGQFTVDSYRPYGSSIYIVFREGVTNRIRGRKIR